MHNRLPRARDWVKGLIPVLALLGACDRAPTEPAAPPMAAAKSGKIEGEFWAFSSDHVGGKRAIYLMTTDGVTLKRITNPPPGYSDTEPDIAPGNQNVVFTRVGPGGASEIYRVDVQGKGLTQLTSFGGVVQSPTYSQYGDKIAFLTDKDGPINLYTMAADGSNLDLASNTFMFGRATWWGQGSLLIYASAGTPNNLTFWRWNLFTGGEIIMECGTQICSNPTAEPLGPRVIYEYRAAPADAPVLKMLDLNTGYNEVFPGVTGTVGGWNPNADRFAFVSDDGSTIKVLEVGSHQVQSIVTLPGQITRLIWSR